MKVLPLVLLIIFTPCFGWAVAQAFFAGPASYAMHRLKEEPSTSLELVVRADTLGSRGCRKRAILEGSNFMWQRQVCAISDEAVSKLARGGRIRLLGTSSPYGALVERYAVASDA